MNTHEAKPSFLARPRPFLCRLLPKRVRTSLYYRFYHTRSEEWQQLFSVASLSFAPSFNMHSLIPGDIVSGNIAFTGFYELELSRQLVRLSRHGGLFIDVGANMGYFSLLWAAGHHEARVIAFEASPRNIELLSKNVFENNLNRQIKVVPKAAANRSGFINFDVGPPEQTGWGGIAELPSASTIRTPTVRLDEELNNSVIDVLKVDVEGADTWVILGCEGLLKNRRIKTIYYEENEPRMKELGIDAREANNFLESFGYPYVPGLRELG